MSKRLIITLEASLMIISIIILALSVFYLPYAANRTVEIFPEVSYLRYPILIGIYLTCIPFYVGIFQTFKLIRFIKRENVLTKQASKSLRVITLSAFSVITLYMIGIIYLDGEQALPPALFLLGIFIILVSIVIAVSAEALKARF